MAWLWTDTLADLLETIDRVDPDALVWLRRRPVAYRLDDGGDPVGLARRVLEEIRPGEPVSPRIPGPA